MNLLLRISKSHLPLLPAFFAGCLLAGCSSSEELAERRFELRLSAASEEGQAVSGVRFSSGTTELGTTDASGRIEVRLRGREGGTLPLAVGCPEGYGEHEGLEVRLATTRGVGEDTPRPLEIDVVCVRSLRDVVLVVHAPGGKELPIEVDGRRVGTTDETGSAHVAFALPRKAPPIQVRLGTDDDKRLRPQNPSRIFELGERDTIALFEQSFSMAAAPRKARPREAPPPRHVPVRIR